MSRRRRESLICRSPAAAATVEKCRKRGIRVCGDFLAFEEHQLITWFGSSGPWFHRLCRGQDDRPVSVSRERKSCGIEDTFPKDLHTEEQALEKLKALTAGLEKRLMGQRVRGRTVTLKVRYGDFTQITRSRTLHDPVAAADHIMPVLRELMHETEIGRRPIRLLGVSLSHLDESATSRQLLLPFYEKLLQPPEPRGVS